MKKIQLFMLIILLSISYGNTETENPENDANILGRIDPPPEETTENSAANAADPNIVQGSGIQPDQLLQLGTDKITDFITIVQTALNKLSPTEPKISQVEQTQSIEQPHNNILQRLLGAPKRAINGLTYLLLGPP